MRNLLKPLLAVKSRKGYSIITAVMVTLFSAWIVFDATKVKVVIANDDDVQTVKTHGSTVADLLDEAGIHVGEHDYLSHHQDTKLTDGMEIVYKQAEKIQLTVDGNTETHYTIEDTVGEFFSSIDFELGTYDVSSHDEDEAIEADMEINVKKAFEIEVVDGKDKDTFWTIEQTVEQFLEENNITLNKLDKVKPKKNKVITKDTKLEITRIVEKEKVVEEAIAFETVKEKDASLEKGKKKVTKEGKDGLAKVTYKITKENGKEVDREVIEEEILEKPVKQIVKVGTKEPATPSASGMPAGSGEVLTMEATGYGRDCAGCSGITATGIDIRNNPNIKVISVDPNVIPLGSKVWVEGYGVAIAGDTGGAIKGNRIDVLLPSEAYAAQHWGRRTVQVKILN